MLHRNVIRHAVVDFLASATRPCGFGPCCFCNEEIQETDVDPCRLTAETSAGKWQVLVDCAPGEMCAPFTHHGSCF